MSFDFKLRRSLMGLSYPPAMWNPVWLSPLDPAMMSRFFERPLDASHLYSEAVDQWEAGAGHTLIDRTLEFYTRFYLQENILTKVDRAAMMCSLESRAVFLDNDLVEFCRRLPARFKYRRGECKYLLKRAMRGVVPESVLARPKKGFGIPLAKWLRLLSVTQSPEPIPGMRLDEVARAWQEHREGRADHRLFLWSWLSLQACVRKYAAPRTPFG
jgi:asparagine synthase (glutamine-hydrolysing)